MMHDFTMFPVHKSIELLPDVHKLSWYYSASDSLASRPDATFGSFTKKLYKKLYNTQKSGMTSPN